MYCENAKVKDNTFDFETKSYAPQMLNLQEIAKQLKDAADSDPSVTPPWMNYLRDGLNILGSNESDFNSPSIETDKLFMTIGEKDLIEVSHPMPHDKSVKR